jgi:hypothetical protein
LDHSRYWRKKGEVGYQLELPPQLSDVHDVFYVSQLKKFLCVPEEQIPIDDLDDKEDLSYQEYPIKILETSERVTQNKRIKMSKVQWSHHIEEEATWEREEELKAEFPSFFSDPSKSRGQDSFSGGRFVALRFIKINNYDCRTHAAAYFCCVMKCSCILFSE